MSSIKSIVNKINKEYQSDSFDRPVICPGNHIPPVQKLKSRAASFAYALEGGFPLGRVVEISGVEHSGKSTLACLAISDYQRQFPDKVCVYVDAESSLDLDFQSKMNDLLLDEEHFLYISPDGITGEGVLDIILRLQDADEIGLIVLDSLPSLVSAAEIDKGMLKDAGMAGNMAKSYHKFFKQMQAAVHAKGNLFIAINQVRCSGKTITGAKILNETGGDAPKYYSSCIIRAGKRTFIKGDKVDEYKPDDADGFQLHFAIIKNKCASAIRGGGFISYLYETGLDEKRDLIDVAINAKYIARPTMQKYTLVNLLTGEIYKDEYEPYYKEQGEDLNIVGKANVIEYFNNHPEFTKEYIDMLTTYMSSGSDTSDEKLLQAEMIEAIKTEG